MQFGEFYCRQCLARCDDGNSNEEGIASSVSASIHNFDGSSWNEVVDKGTGSVSWSQPATTATTAATIRGDICARLGYESGIVSSMTRIKPSQDPRPPPSGLEFGQFDHKDRCNLGDNVYTVPHYSDSCHSRKERNGGYGRDSAQLIQTIVDNAYAPDVLTSAVRSGAVNEAVLLIRKGKSKSAVAGTAGTVGAAAPQKRLNLMDAVQVLEAIPQWRGVAPMAGADLVSELAAVTDFGGSKDLQLYFETRCRCAVLEFLTVVEQVRVHARTNAALAAHARNTRNARTHARARAHARTHR